jgi:hypothetical protein
MIFKHVIPRYLILKNYSDFCTITFKGYSNYSGFRTIISKVKLVRSFSKMNRTLVNDGIIYNNFIIDVQIPIYMISLIYTH